MRLIPVRLGHKLNLSLFLFMLAVGLATAGLVYFGFDRSKDNATRRSRQGLEQLGQQRMLNIAANQADQGELSLEWAADAGQMAARYLADLSRTGAQFSFDASRLVRAENGLLYDPDPNRRTDVAMPNFAPLNAEAIRDVIDSAALDALFPGFLTSYPGRLRQTNFDAIAVFFVSVNQVTRYYPPIGLEKVAPPDVDQSDRLALAGPQRNPERRTVWTTPYLDRAGNGMVVTAYTPAYFGGDYRGVVGIDLSLNKLVAQVDGARATPGGFAFFVDRDGNLLPTQSLELISRELDGGNAALSAVIESMKSGGSEVTRLRLDGGEYFVAYAPLQNTGGSFAAAAPVAEMTAQASAIQASIDSEGNRTVLVVLMVVAAFFAAGLTGATWMNRRLLLRPIEALAEGTRRVAAGELDTQIAVRGEDEMAVLAASFNQMTSEIRQRRAALEQEIRERRQVQDELRALFAAMTDTVLMVDRNGRFLRVPATSAPSLIVASQEELVGRTLQEILPVEKADELLTRIRRALSEQRTTIVESSLEVDGRMYWFSSAISPTSEDAVVVVARDITERVNAHQELEQRVEERTRELEAILEVSRNLASTLELQPLLQALLDQLASVSNYTRSSIFLLEGEELVMLASQAQGPSNLGLRIRRETTVAIWEQVAAGKVAIIDNVRGDSPMAAAYRAASGDLMNTALSDIRSWMGVPLKVKDRVIGMVTVSHSREDAFDQRQARLVSAIANQAGVAIENARLYEETQRRALEMQVLLRADAELFRSLDLDEVLQALVDLTVDLLGMHKSAVARWDSARGEASIRAARNMSADSAELLRSMAASGMRSMEDAHPVPAVQQGIPADLAPAMQEILRIERIQSSMELPIRTPGGEVLGVFMVAFTEHHDFSPDEQRLVVALAERAAVAAGNAELYARAQQAASLEERQRLARELHDSVSQALYGIALGASTAREVLETDPPQAVEPVEYVLSLAEAGLAEMRALIFELRPESLEIEGLVAAIEKQVAATRARYGIKVEADLCPEPPMLLAQKEVFYRVTQEALHNVVKHANAARIDVRLVVDGDEAVLEVKDDGVGFDDSRSFPGHMGLVSMAERAAGIGGRLTISSVPNRGTLVRLAAVIRERVPSK